MFAADDTARGLGFPVGVILLLFGLLLVLAFLLLLLVLLILLLLLLLLLLLPFLALLILLLSLIALPVLLVLFRVLTHLHHFNILIVAASHRHRHISASAHRALRCSQLQRRQIINFICLFSLFLILVNITSSFQHLKLLLLNSI